MEQAKLAVPGYFKQFLGGILKSSLSREVAEKELVFEVVRLG